MGCRTRDRGRRARQARTGPDQTSELAGLVCLRVLFCAEYPIGGCMRFRGDVLGCVAVLLALQVIAEQVFAFEAQYHPTLTVEPANGSIHIDGDLSDAGWEGAAVADGFVETSPGDQIEPPVQSRALVTFDESNLYVALIAEDKDPASIRSSLSERDNIFRDDYFGIMLDTYGDLGWGYELFVNPLGIQGDLRMQSDGNEDITFDLVWHSEGKITETGYQVEIAIPFASLRFLDRPIQEWRVNFWRDHQREVRRRYAWAAQDLDDPCFICQWGYLKGITSISPGSNVDVIASVVGAQSGRLADPDDPETFENDDPDGDIGLNFRYGVTSSSSAELTINPDFSQIESDAGQIDVNNTFALFFSERRPFFQEGSNLYSTWIDAIYTRTINDPIAAAKFTGKFGKTNVQYLVAQDDSSPLIVPFEEFSDVTTLRKSVTNIARVRQGLSGDSYVGALVTDRRHEGSGSGSVVAVDGRIRLAKGLQWETQAAFSHTAEPEAADVRDGANIGVPSTELCEDDADGNEVCAEPREDYSEFDDGEYTASLDGESFAGHGVYTSLEYGNRRFAADFDYRGYSPTFRTENGFTTRNNYHEAVYWNALYFRPNGALMQSWNMNANVGRVWDYDGRFKDEWFQPNLNFNFIGQSYFGLSALWSKERFAGKTIPGIRRLNISAESRPLETVGVGAYVGRGDLIYRNFRDPQLGLSLIAGVDVDLKPTDRLRWSSSWDYAEMESKRDGSKLFKGYIVRTRVDYSFSRRLFARCILEYDNFREGLSVEPLVTYQINPFTVFYVGANSSRREFDISDKNGLDEFWLEETNRQFFAKISYLWQI